MQGPRWRHPRPTPLTRVTPDRPRPPAPPATPRPQPFRNVRYPENPTPRPDPRRGPHPPPDTPREVTPPPRAARPAAPTRPHTKPRRRPRGAGGASPRRGTGRSPGTRPPLQGGVTRGRLPVKPQGHQGDGAPTTQPRSHLVAARHAAFPRCPRPALTPTLPTPAPRQSPPSQFSGAAPWAAELPSTSRSGWVGVRGRAGKRWPWRAKGPPRAVVTSGVALLR